MTNSFTSLFARELRKNRPVALDVSGDLITWQKFETDISALFLRLSTSSQGRWALCFDNSYWFAVSLFALALADKDIVLPSNTSSKKALSEISQHFDAILTDRDLSNECDVWHPETGMSRCEMPKRILDNVIITLFTSGSTGAATPIQKTFQQLANEVNVLESLFSSYFLDCEVFGTVSHQHIYGLLFRILLPLSLGVPFSDTMLEYPDQVSNMSSSNRTLVSSPALLKRLTIEQVNIGYKKVFSSGGVLPFESANQCSQLFGSMPVEVYGSSETGGIGWREQAALNEPWKVFPDVDVRCTDKGRLEVRSPFILQDHWWLTDDQVSLLPDGRFHLIGRADRIVKVSEKRISLVEVEQRLQEFSEIQEAVAIPLENGNRLEIAAVVVLTEEGSDKILVQGRFAFWSSVKQKLRDHIEPVGLPRRYRVVDQIPINSQGKNAVSALKELFS
ncbi:MAG: acyl--CoA ligase [Desulfuromonadales bacterium]|nr:acyl--CoA ligase [Desulfuromonadales bacterium]